MRLGLMQPYFFPYFEYFCLISNCDLWISFDTAQFSRGSWMNRNRIINRDKGWAYIGLPICRDGLNTPLNEARLDLRIDWKADIINRIDTYRKSAPNYSIVKKTIEEILEIDTNILSEINTFSITKICQFLEIDTRIETLSKMNVGAPNHEAQGGWPLHLCLQLGATEYLNASGGRDLYDREFFQKSGVSLRFQEHIGLEYDTGPFEFVPNLSIIDVLMWVNLEYLRKLVQPNTL